MAEIEREKTIEGLKRYLNYPKPLCDVAQHAITLLKEQEVVRCKDCKYAYLTDDGECKYCEMEKDDNGFLIERYRSWDWFCADGERKEGR